MGGSASSQYACHVSNVKSDCAPFSSVFFNVPPVSPTMQRARSCLCIFNGLLGLMVVFQHITRSFSNMSCYCCCCCVFVVGGSGGWRGVGCERETEVGERGWGWGCGFIHSSNKKTRTLNNGKLSFLIVVSWLRETDFISLSHTSRLIFVRGVFGRCVYVCPRPGRRSPAVEERSGGEGRTKRGWCARRYGKVFAFFLQKASSVQSCVRDGLAKKNNSYGPPVLRSTNFPTTRERRGAGRKNTDRLIAARRARRRSL